MKNKNTEVSPVKDLIDLLSKKIRSIVDKSKNKKANVQSTLELIDEVITSLRSNYDYILEVDLKLFEDLLTKSFTFNEKINEIFSSLELPLAVANGRKKGYDIDYLKEEEEVVIDKFINLLALLKDDIKEKATRLEQESISLELEGIVYGSIYDKLRIGFDGTEYIEKDELSKIMELIKDKPVSYKKDILKFILALNKRVELNRLVSVQKVEDPEDEEITNTDIIEEDMVRELFEKYGYSVDNMPKDIMEAIQKRCRYQKMIEIFEVLTTNPEFYFTKSYGVGTKSKNDIRKEYKQLYHLLRFSSKEILLYLLKNANDKSIAVNEFFNVPGVIKKVSKRGTQPSNGSDATTDDLSLSGSFEYFQQNEKIFDDLTAKLIAENPAVSVDIFKYVLDYNPCLLASNPERVRKDLELFEIYKLDILVKEGKSYIPYVTGLGTENINFLDALIEEGFYDYIQQYRSCLDYSASFAYMLIKHQHDGTIEYLPSGRIKKVRRLSDRRDPALV